MNKPREVPVTLFGITGDTGRPAIESGYIADTPENREALEAAAIPRCREWRETNPEWSAFVGHQIPAPYCCSAYCDRCNGLRALNGDDPAIRPNEWMYR